MRCSFVKPDNSQCQANSMVGFDYCFSHNPQTAFDKQKAVLKGGKSPKQRKVAKLQKPLPIKSVKDVLILLESVINELRTVEAVTHQRANSIGYLSSIILKALEADNLETRVVALEEKLLVSK